MSCNISKPSIQGLEKLHQNRNFWYENIPSGVKGREIDSRRVLFFKKKNKTHFFKLVIFTQRRLSCFPSH
jgi:hypothetical protein